MTIQTRKMVNLATASTLSSRKSGVMHHKVLPRQPVYLRDSDEPSSSSQAPQNAPLSPSLGSCASSRESQGRGFGRQSGRFCFGLVNCPAYIVWTKSAKWELQLKRGILAVANSKYEFNP